MTYTLKDKRKLRNIDLTDENLLSSNPSVRLLDELEVVDEITNNPSEIVIQVLAEDNDLFKNEFVLNTETRTLSNNFGESYDVSTPEKLAYLIEQSDSNLDWGLIEEYLYTGYFCPCCGQYLGQETFDLCNHCKSHINEIESREIKPI